MKRTDGSNRSNGSIEKDFRLVKKMEHRAYLMRFKEGRVGDYVDVHKKEKIWESVVEGLRKSGFEKMIIFQHGRDIILFEEARDLNKAYDYLGNDTESVKWDKMIAEWMDEFPQYNEIKGDIEFHEIPVVFYFQDGEMLHK